MSDPENTRRGRGRPPGIAAKMAEAMNVSPRDIAVTFNTRGIARIQAAGNDALADEIVAALEQAIATGKERSWISGVEYVARFPADEQRDAWELLQRRGPRWLKRYTENVRNPKTAEQLADSILRYLNREHPGVDEATLVEALERLAHGLRG